jgi:hypothetical protein
MDHDHQMLTAYPGCVHFVKLGQCLLKLRGFIALVLLEGGESVRVCSGLLLGLLGCWT